MPGATLADDQRAAVFFDRRKLRAFFILDELVTARDGESRDAAVFGINTPQLLIGHIWGRPLTMIGVVVLIRI